MTAPTTYYCQPSDVSEFLTVSPFSDSPATKPTLTAVAKIILRKEEQINQRTHRSWKTVTVTNELHNLDDYYMVGYGVEIRLLYRHIKTFDYAQGDRIQYWNGSDWQDLLTASGLDSNISYVDYENGRIHTKSAFFSYITEYKFRVTYRYGEDTVPADIEEACILMTCIELTNTSFRSNLLPQGNIKTADTVTAQWDLRVSQILADRAEMVVIGS